VKPERLACGGAVHALGRKRSLRYAAHWRKHAFAERGVRHRPPLWRRLIEPLLTVIAVAVVAALVGIVLNLVGR
jgi:hypothetical protein